MVYIVTLESIHNIVSPNIPPEIYNFSDFTRSNTLDHIPVEKHYKSLTIFLKFLFN